MDNYFSIYHHRATNMPRDTRSQLIANFLGRKRTKISVKEIIRLFGIVLCKSIECSKMGRHLYSFV